MLFNGELLVFHVHLKKTILLLCNNGFNNINKKKTKPPFWSHKKAQKYLFN